MARRSYGRLVAWLAARIRDISLAEDALAEAFRIALERWPVSGVPANPEGWLVTVARREMLGRMRAAGRAAEAGPMLRLLEEERMETAGTTLPDHRLALLFACAHPAIEDWVRAPLMLQTVLGHDAAAIAGAYAIAPATMGQRLVRAKAKIRAAGIPFALPDAGALAERLPPVLDAIYAAFGLSWDDPSGHTLRPDLSEEALWLADLLTRAMPEAAEALGLCALMLHAHARRAARRDPTGAFVPLDEQDCRLWDSTMQAKADRVLARAAALRDPGRYQIEAAIQSVHAERAQSGVTAWEALLGLYRQLWPHAPTLGTLAGEAAVLGRLGRGEAGLARLDSAAGAAQGFQPWWAVRADLLHRLGRAEAAEAYARARDLATDPALRAWLDTKRAEAAVHR